MANVCLYFELHQPYRLSGVDVFDIGHNQNYFERANEEDNRIIFQKVARKSYVPMLRLLLELARTYPQFNFSFSASGVFLEQAQLYAPVVIELLQKLVATGQAEVLSETYYHSLAALYSPQEFQEQVAAHTVLVQELFEITPQVFRNTELIYSNEIGQQVAQLGYIGCLTEAVDRYLHGRTRKQVFQAHLGPDTKNSLPLLLKHAQLSDDVAFRFSNKAWKSYPLTADTYHSWIESGYETDLINLFMDFETFGEHQWEDTGIFEFFAQFVQQIITSKKSQFVTPSMVFESLESTQSTQLPVYDVPEPISWADVDRDLTAWLDNDLQQDTIGKLYSLEKTIKERNDSALLENWRKLQTSDHFYYMCTKWSADGDVHAYFSPYDSPFEAYRKYAVVLADLHERIL